MGVNVPNPSPPIPMMIVPPTPTGSDRAEQARADGREIVKQAEVDNHNALTTGLDQFVRARQTQRTANTVLARDQAARANTEAKQLDRFVRPEAPVEIPHGEPPLAAGQFVPPPTDTHAHVLTRDPALPPQPNLSQAQPTPAASQTNNGSPQQNSGNTGGQPHSGNPQTALPQQTAEATPRPGVNPEAGQPRAVARTTTTGSPDAQSEGTPSTPQTFANLMSGRPATVTPRVTAQTTAPRVPGQPVPANPSLPTPLAQVPGQKAQEAPARGVRIFCMGTPHPGDPPAEAVHHQLEQAAVFRQCLTGGGSTTAARPLATQPPGAVVVQAGAQQQREPSLRDIMRGRGNPNVAHNRGSRNRVTEVTARDVALGVQRDRSSIPA